MGKYLQVFLFLIDNFDDIKEQVQDVYKFIQSLLAKYNGEDLAGFFSEILETPVETSEGSLDGLVDDLAVKYPQINQACCDPFEPQEVASGAIVAGFKKLVEFVRDNPELILLILGK